MIVLSALKIEKSFGANQVLADASFVLQQGARMGLVGSNGSGKSTLLRIIMGLETPDGGAVNVTKGFRIGYLSQHAALDGEATILEEAQRVFEPLRQKEKRLRALEEEMASSHSDEKAFREISAQYTRLMDEFERLGGYEWPSLTQGVLVGLGFSREEYGRKVSTLSGGERTRLCLARLLLDRPDILLLDEPTNHLDMGALAWLEDFLAKYRGSLLVVSHDRFFMDAVCTEIADIFGGRTTTFAGGYTKYVEKRAAVMEQQARQWSLQQREIDRQQAIIARYRRFNREKSIRAAESREKLLERLKDGQIDRPLEEKTADFSFFTRRISGEDVLMVEGISKTFGDRSLFEDVSVSLRQGDRLAIIGPNGAGKSTLLKCIVGAASREALGHVNMDALSACTADKGRVALGVNVDIGYFDQQQEQVVRGKTPIDVIWNAFPKMREVEVRNALASMLFTGDDVFQSVEALSGGERARVLLCKLMLAGDNLLIMDEPTNHLDMDSREVLESALSDYDGTLVVVSHDRYFINRLCNRVLEIRDGGWTAMDGNWDSFVAAQKDGQMPEPDPYAGLTKTEQSRQQKKQRQQKEQIAQAQKQLALVESEIAATEEAIAALEKEMAKPETYQNSGLIAELTRGYNDKKQQLEALYETWEEAGAAVAALEMA